MIDAQQALRTTFAQPIELEVIIEPVFNAENVLARQTLSDELHPIRILSTRVTHIADTTEIVASVSAANLNRAMRQTELRTDCTCRGFRRASDVEYRGGNRRLNPI